MTPDDLDAELTSGTLRPLYVIVGEERFLADRATRKLRAAALAGAIADFNEDQFTAGSKVVGRALTAARTAPMMAARRLVIIHGIDRWEGDDEPAGHNEKKSDDDAPSKHALAPLDALAEYAGAPSSTTTMVLTAAKLNKQRRLMTAAKKGGFIVQCDRLPEHALGAFVTAQTRERGNTITSSTATFIAQIVGSELAYLVDAVERLSLYVGAGKEITEDDVSEVVVRLRQASVFTLVDALGKRDLASALATFEDVFDARSAGLPILGMIAWNVRTLVRFEAAIAKGSRAEEAAIEAGAPPFKARELQTVVARIPRLELERWLSLLAETDLELKSSRRSPRTTMETLLVSMCRRGA